jgi:hypothetical protein
VHPSGDESCPPSVGQTAGFHSDAQSADGSMSEINVKVPDGIKLDDIGLPGEELG